MYYEKQNKSVLCVIYNSIHFRNQLPKITRSPMRGIPSTNFEKIACRRKTAVKLYPLSPQNTVELTKAAASRTDVVRQRKRTNKPQTLRCASLKSGRRLQENLHEFPEVRLRSEPQVDTSPPAQHKPPGPRHIKPAPQPSQPFSHLHPNMIYTP